MKQQLTIGRIVHVFVDGRSNNGGETCPAILTRVWGSGELNHDTPVASVNMRLVLDHASNDAACQEWRTSAQVFIDRAAAEAFLQHTADQSYPLSPVPLDVPDKALDLQAEYVRSRRASGMVAFMPERV